MLNIHTLLTFAIAEMRSCRRLVRTWVFIVAAYIFCTVLYIELIDQSSWVSSPGTWVFGSVNPRYVIDSLTNSFVAIFSFGVIFLAFDIRARDVQNRIHDVVDTLAATNFEIILGRLLGILTLLLIPCLFFLLIVASYEFVTYLIGSQHRIGIQPMSVLSLVVWNLLPNLIFFSALVAFLATLVRVRLIVAAIAIGILIGLFWVENHIPVRLQESLSPFLGSSLLPSDLAPVFVTSAIVGSRCAMLLTSVALFMFAASLLPRTEPLRRLRVTFGITASIASLVAFFGLLYAVFGTESQKDEWVKVHQQKSPSAFPDVQSIEGSIELRPGRNISLDVTLTVLTPVANTTDSVIFSLNPGYKIQSLFVDGTKSSNFSFDSGVLKISGELLPNASHKVRLKAKGKPDDRFAYLDQARDFQKLTHRGVRLQGLRNSIFHRDFVVLMPGIFWYPKSGTAINRDEIEQRPRDLFTTELSVSLPRNWQAATVGTREVVEPQTNNTASFINKAPVPELALIAAKFDQRTQSIEGVQFEFLISKSHSKNLDVLSPFADQLHEWIAERITTAQSLSLDYPYGAFYVVEVPSNLRIYGGGWRMDSVLQPPGMMLIRETAFPTAQFESLVAQVRRERDQESSEEGEGDEQVFNRLLAYFGNDLQGGNPFAGFARNFVSHQVSSTQQGATAIQYLLGQLSNQLITQIESYSVFSMQEYDTYVPYLGVSRRLDYRGVYAAASVRERISTLPSTWEIMEQVALFDLDFNGSPIPSYRVLLTKGHTLAKSMIAYYGADEIGMLLNQLLTNYRGQHITLDDLREVAAEAGIDLDEWVLPWLQDTSLPGYIVQSTSVSKIETDALGDTEFQTEFVLRNAEPMPGFVRVSWSNHADRIHLWGYEEIENSDPIFLTKYQSKRIAIRSASPLTWIWVDPFLSHNRAMFEVLVPEYKEINTPERSALPFASDVEWKSSDRVMIVVDDLDPNFSIVSRTGVSDPRSSTPRVFPSLIAEGEYDHGLRVTTDPQLGEWNRSYESSSYGRYRRTFARIAGGDQASAARFAVNLPHDGLWKLEFYVPKPAFRHRYYGSYVDVFGAAFEDSSFRIRPAQPNDPEEYYRLVIKEGDAERNEQFNIGKAKLGWNEIGNYDLKSNEVEVYLSDWAGHDEVMVYADAIRWTFVESR